VIAFVLRRLTLAVPSLLVAAVTIFVLMRVVPGDPALLFIGDLENQQAITEMRERLGLGKPLAQQFLVWLEQMARGDLGSSIATGEPVSRLLLDAFPITAQVVLIATAVTSLLAIPGGILAAWRQNTKTDAAILTGASLSQSIPGFWMALTLILVFGVELGWLPTVGHVSFADSPHGWLRHLLLPVAALVLTQISTLTRMTRSSTIEVLRLDYITHARAKGLTEAAILYRHALRNAFAPVLTVLGLMLGHLLGGVVVIETMFALPGLGRLLVDAIFQRDYPVVQGCMLFIAVIYTVVNLLVDLLYPLFDPRVRLE